MKNGEDSSIFDKVHSTMCSQMQTSQKKETVIRRLQRRKYKIPYQRTDPKQREISVRVQDDSYEKNMINIKGPKRRRQT